MNLFQHFLLISIFSLAILQIFQSSSQISSFKLNLKTLEKAQKVYSSANYNSDSLTEVVYLSFLNRPSIWQRFSSLIFLFFVKDEENNFIQLTDLVNKFDKIGFFDDKYRDFSDLFRNYLHFYLDADKNGQITKEEWDSHSENQRLYMLWFLGESAQMNSFENESIAPDVLKTEQFLDRNFDESKNDLNYLTKKFTKLVKSDDKIKREFVEILFEYFDLDKNKEITVNEISSLLSDLRKQYRIGFIENVERVFNTTTHSFFEMLDSNRNEVIENEKEMKNLPNDKIDKIIEFLLD